MDNQPERPSETSESTIRDMLEESRRDIDAGRTKPLAPVLDRMRAAAEGIRGSRAKTAGIDRRRA